MPNYNAVLILEAIAKAPIPDDRKLQAVNDIEKMYIDKEYGNGCFVNHLTIPVYNRACLQGHHYWAKSNLGHEFWQKMDKIIS